MPEPSSCVRPGAVGSLPYRQRGRIIPIVIAAAVVPAVLLIAAGIWLWLALAWLHGPMSFAEEPVRFEIRRGETLRSVTRRLADRGILERPGFFEGYARLQGEAERIVAGRYVVGPGDSPLELLRRLVAGDVERFRLTLPEGLTVDEMVARVQSHPEIRATLEPPEAATLLAALPSELPSAEGRLYPDTYVFEAGTADLTVLRQAWERMDAALRDAWTQRDLGLTLTSPEELLVLASIVEKETGYAPDRPLIAAVLHRRLEQGMRLQSDPTVIYGLGDDFDGDLRRADLRRDTPWNTYTRHGLPPTPIAAPGKAALDAAAHPAATQALYFVAAGDGRSVFSETLAQHRAAVELYQIAPARERARTRTQTARVRP